MRGSGVLLALSVAWISGCATSGSADSAWQVPAPHPSFSKVLIVGISTDYNQRCNFEFAMASQFEGTTQPVVSCNSMTQTDLLTSANIERVAKAQQADAVLTTTVVTMQVGSEPGTKIPYYKVVGVGYATGPLGDYGVPVAFVQLASVKTLPTVTGDAHLLTKIFNVKNAALVYTADTETKADDLQSGSVTIETVTGQIGNRLRRDGVIH
jgi:hypothetical protein